MAVDFERLLKRPQKEAIVKTRLEVEGVRFPFRLRYDRRYGWHYAVTKGTWTTVTFSTSITDPRFPQMVKRCARAINDVGSGTLARQVRGPEREEGEE